MKRIFLFIALISFAGIAFAQNQSLELSKLMDRSLSPQRVHSLQFFPNSNNYCYVLDNKLMQASEKVEAKEFFGLSEVNAILKSAGEKEINYFPAVTAKSPNTFLFHANAKLYLLDMKAKTLQTLNSFEGKTENLDIENTNYQAAFTKENNLYIIVDGKEQAVTNDSNKEIVYGQAAHRSEFGIRKGIFWSPKGNLLAFYRMDETMVTDYPLVNINSRIAETTLIKYPMAGMASHHVTLGVYNVFNGKTIYLNTRKDESLAEKESYLTNITWSPDEKFIYIAKLNRAQNFMELNCYNAETGDFVKTLFTEQSDKYVEPQFGLYFIPNRDNEFLYLSQRDGFMHIYHYNTDGKLLKQLTKGDWLVKSIASFNEKGTEIFFSATKESPLETHFYSVQISNGKMTKITQEKGSHYVAMNSKGDLFLDTYTNRTVPSQTLLLNKKGKTLTEIYTSENPLANYRLPEMEFFTIKAADETTDLYCRMIKPLDFDATKKYPVIVYAYGGPHTQLISETWLGGANLYFMFLAQQGYIVWTVDSRGSSNRGFAFESAIHRCQGDVECADQMKGVEYLKSQSFVDADRIAVDGWSYGGFLTISLKLRYPGVFKVATAGGPVIDWKWYEIMYGERYAASYEDNKDAYEQSNLLNYVKNLEGKLLIIHGAQDPTVVWQHSLQFIDACVKQRKQVDYFVYPNHEHNVRGADRVHLFEKLYRYYEDNL